MVLINDLSFNQDYSCISLSTSEYHKIFNCEPFGEFYASNQGGIKRSISNSIEEETNINNGIRSRAGSLAGLSIDGNGDGDEVGYPTAYLKMLFSTSLTIIIPDSNNKLGKRVLKIYNLKQNLKICELNFSSNIINIKLNRKRLLVFLEIGQIYIYDLSCVRLIKILDINSYFNDTTNTTSELIGDLCSSNDERSYLVLPISAINDQTDLFNAEPLASNGGGNGNSPSRSNSTPSTPLLKPSDSTIINNNLDSLIVYTSKDHHLAKKSNITLDDLKKDSQGWIIVYDTIALKPKLIFKAHNSAIGKISISNDKIASASIKGTIIRVFTIQEDSNNETLRISQVLSLRRGHNLAKINALSFNSDNRILGCGSESNTIHFFKLDDSDESHNDEGDSDNEGGGAGDDGGESSSRSSEDLNENLANLLLSKPTQATPQASNKDNESNGKSSSYFSFATLKQTKKLINNQYTKSIIKKLPYKDYFDNLIWEPPRRSFAYIKLPEYTPPHYSHHQDLEDSFQSQSHRHDTNNRVEIGFNNSLILLASYQTGIFYQYQLPNYRKHHHHHHHSNGSKGEEHEEEKREECYLINQYNMI
ncbi:autophagy-related protein 21 [Scheffersomyces coipomensis]|uniref:autophagy-related protein 21 n=1 Tax=Scheffersomyces coipomensis TaxID=1788519 RepID=UPI00315D314D